MSETTYVPRYFDTTIEIRPRTEDDVELETIRLALTYFQQGFGYEPTRAERAVRDRLLARRVELWRARDDRMADLLRHILRGEA